jgi:hypothetical protein
VDLVTHTDTLHTVGDTVDIHKHCGASPLWTQLRMYGPTFRMARVDGALLSETLANFEKILYNIQVKNREQGREKVLAKNEKKL